MNLLNYEKEIVKRHLVELEEPIDGESLWIRVSRNGALEAWKPSSKSKVPAMNLNGEISEDVKDKLELKFRRSQYG